MLRFRTNDFLEWSSKLQLPDPIGNSSFEGYKQHLRFLRSVSSAVSVENELAVAAFHMYRISRLQSCGATLDEVIGVCGASRSKVWELIKNSDTFLASSPQTEWDLLHKYLMIFELKGRRAEDIRSELEKTAHHVTSSPMTKLCHAFQTVLAGERKMKEVCRVFNVSPSAIFRFRKKMFDQACSKAQ